MESSLCLFYGRYFLDIFGWGIELASWPYGVVTSAGFEGTWDFGEQGI